MPAGVSYLRFISFCSMAILSMMAGAQCVHVVYKPLDDLDDLIEQAVKERLAET